MKAQEFKMRNLKIVLLMVMITVAAFGQSKVGTTAANFLTIPVGARASAMGGAAVATSNDATGLYWNPASISRLTKSEFAVSYSEWFVGTKYNWVGLVYKVDENNSFGISINQLDYGEETVTTESDPEGTTGEKWDASDIALGISYSRNLTDRFSVGATVKYIRQQIWHETASAFALDVGLLFYTQLEGLRLGMNITNFGSEMQLDGKDLYQSIDIDNRTSSGNNENIAGALSTDSWMLPLYFTVGLGYDVVNTEQWKICTGLDAIYPNNQNAFLNAGGEITWNDMISLRAGYNSIMKSQSLAKICAGIGVKYDFGPFYAKVDYSYNDYKYFKEISKVSLSIGF
jgi:hypothetical protein